jgi:hypothetical protein
MSENSVICPRCLHAIPNDQNPGLYVGAKSRRDNTSEVCSKCGNEEAMIQFEGGDLSDEVWPVEVREGSR